MKKIEACKIATAILLSLCMAVLLLPHELLSMERTFAVELCDGKMTDATATDATATDATATDATATDATATDATYASATETDAPDAAETDKAYAPAATATDAPLAVTSENGEEEQEENPAEETQTSLLRMALAGSSASARLASPRLMAARAGAGTRITIRQHGTDYIDGNNVFCQFTASSSIFYVKADVAKGFCADHGKIAPKSNTVYIAKPFAANEKALKALFYSYVGSGEKAYSGWSGMSGSKKIAVLTCLMNYYANGSWNSYVEFSGYTTYAFADDTVTRAKSFDSWLSRAKSPKEYVGADISAYKKKSDGTIKTLSDGDVVESDTYLSNSGNGRAPEYTTGRIHITGKVRITSIPDGLTLQKDDGTGSFVIISEGAYVENTDIRVLLPVTYTGSYRIDMQSRYSYPRAAYIAEPYDDGGSDFTRYDTVSKRSLVAKQRIMFLGAYGSDESFSVTVKAKTAPGSLKLSKKAVSSFGSMNASGAEYTMYNSAGTAVARFKTVADGTADVSVLEGGLGLSVTESGKCLSGIAVGRYTVKETKAPPDCELDTHTAVFTVTESGGTSLKYYEAERNARTHEVSWTEKTKTMTDSENGRYLPIIYTATDLYSYDPVGLSLVKVDADTGKTFSGSASLEGAVFEVRYYKGVSADKVSGSTAATSVWHIMTKKVGDEYRAELSEDYIYPMEGDSALPENKGKNGYFYLEPGTVKLTEIKASQGYLTVGESSAGYASTAGIGAGSDSILLNISDGSLPYTCYGNRLAGDEIVIFEPVIRGDIKFSKHTLAEDGTLKPLAGVVFKITGRTSGEYHYVVTDKNGEFDSSKNRTGNINGNCSRYRRTGTYTYEQKDTSSSYGVWFSGNDDVCENVEPSGDDRGAFPYDTYIIEEMPCDANAGLIGAAAREITVDKDSTTFEAGDFVNVRMSLHTLSDDYVSPGKEAELNDIVEITGLEAGKTYTVKGIVMDKSTGSPALDGDGRLIAANSTFTAPEEGATGGYISRYVLEKDDAVRFTFNSEEMDGEYVVFEYLCEGSDEETLSSGEAPENVIKDIGGVPVGHYDLENSDYSQTFTVPRLKTNAYDSVTGTNVVDVTDTTVINDIVHCTGLIPGRSYTVRGTLRVRETGEEVRNKDEEPVTGSTTFTASAADEDVTVSYTFNALECGLFGKTLVAFEGLYYEETEIVVHEDLSDQEQTVYVPKISSVLTVTSGSVEKKETEETCGIKLTDQISVINLAADMKYRVECILYSAEKKVRLEDLEGYFIYEEEGISGGGDIDITAAFREFDCDSVGIMNEDGSVDAVTAVTRLYVYTDDPDCQVMVYEHNGDFADRDETIEISNPPETHRVPGTPDTPDTPTPGTPDMPDTPTPGTPDVPGSPPKTGDNSLVSFVTGIFAVTFALTAVIAALRLHSLKKKRLSRKNT